MRTVLGGLGLALGVCALCFAFIPLLGVFPAGLCLSLGSVLSLWSLLLGRFKDKVWDWLAAGGLLANLGAAGVAVGVNFLFFWALERLMVGLGRLLEELVEPLQNYPGF